MLATVGLHAAIVAALLTYEPARKALLAAAPIMIDLIVPPRIEQPEPKRIEPPKPKPVAKIPPRPIELPPVLSAPAQAPSPIVVAPPPPAPPQPAPIESPPTPPAPLPVSQPIFNADYLENPAPPYPPLSRRSGEQGRVILRVLVNTGGRTDNIEVRASSGFPRLDASARETVQRWKFVPAKRGNEPVSAWVLIPISFKLEG